MAFFDSVALPAKPTQATIAPSTWHAFLSLDFVKTPRGTVLKHSQHKGPLYVQKSFYPEGKAVAHTYLLHPPGGIVSGDCLHITANLAQDTHVLITTPGAGRVYRAREDKTQQQQVVQLNVGANSVMEWLPQETILYPNAYAQLENQINLADDAKFIGWEITCLGLPANQESFGAGALDQRLRIYQNGRLNLFEKLIIDGHGADIKNANAGLKTYPVNGVMIAGPFLQEPNDLLNTLRQYCADHTVLTGVSLVGDYLIIRSLHTDSEQMKQVFIECWHAIRPELIGKQANAPKIWAT
ncbi:urease accessory protein UreD [Marinomonas agarivorans]|nr:urease accessory protein UreD [Marinomonas agarivorans]